MLSTSSKLLLASALLLAVAGNALAQDPARDSSTRQSLTQAEIGQHRRCNSN